MVTKTKTAKKRIAKAKEDPVLACPRCRIDMEKLTKNNVTIDVCSRCKGMWLDAGEIEQLAAMQRGKK